MEFASVEGDGHVERVILTSLDDGSTQSEKADALFIFIGTRPRSDWLPPEVLRDAKGFVLTGRDLMAADATRVSGKSSVNRCCSRPAFPESLPREICAPAR